jgi:uncharacterized membrane protein
LYLLLTIDTSAAGDTPLRAVPLINVGDSSEEGVHWLTDSVVRVCMLVGIAFGLRELPPTAAFTRFGSLGRSVHHWMT